MPVFIRAFVCIEIPEEERKKIASVLSLLKKEYPNLKWVAPSGLHVTLKFCGELQEDQLQLFSSSLKKSLAQAVTKPFQIRLGSIGGFPSLRSPRVLWVGVSEGAPVLEELKNIVETSGFSAGLEKEERPFHPHLTLARIRYGKGVPQELEERLKKIDFSGLRWEAHQMILMQSQLRPEGPFYTPLETYSL
ncbi:RNA 2',3'-cyclic phosphodiesterase [Aminobacterium mobile]|jgi:2'-5' RNA ligase|uniref:RNA 2',3'-cyclic phosphodiesterase n=1 Tax=Aminobacterium mobile TaxID=81467 RepID=UPI000464587D|nr:RNA 2',3'-cyclic phosphodiesterase [Aminobacterium mobile]